MRAAFWWIDRWRQSTAYTDMSAEEQGLYRNLCDEIWLRDDHVIPDDQRILSRVSGDPEAWVRCSKKVLQWMKLVPGGWTQEVALQVIDQSTRRSEKQKRYRGKAGNAGGNESGNGSGNAGGSMSLDQDKEKEQTPEQKQGGQGEGGPRGETATEPARPPRCGVGPEWFPPGHPRREQPPEPQGLGEVVTDPLWIDHDPEDPDQAALVARVLELERADALADGRPPEREFARNILAAVSGTRSGKCIDDGSLINVKREWLVASLAACDTLAEENGLLGDQAAMKPHGE